MNVTEGKRLGRSRGKERVQGIIIGREERRKEMAPFHFSQYPFRRPHPTTFWTKQILPRIFFCLKTVKNS